MQSSFPAMPIKEDDDMKEKRGYVLVYSIIAMTLCCTLVLSIVTMVLHSGNNIRRAVGAEGALCAADSGIEGFENYLNKYYVQKGNLKTNAVDLWITVYDIIEEIVPVNRETQNSKAKLGLQGYMNYNYVISAADKVKSLSADTTLNGAYKVYISEMKKGDIRKFGKLVCLSIGEYVYQNKSYYKFITVELVIEPVYTAGIITGLRLKTVKYNDSINGGTELWGNVSW